MNVFVVFGYIYGTIQTMEIKDAQDTITWPELRNFTGSLFRMTLQKIKKYWYLFLLIILLPLALFLGRTYFKEKQYQLQSTLGFHYLHQKIYGQLTNELNYLLTTADYDALNERLQTSEINWSAISSIEATNIFGYRLDEDLGDSEYPFYLIVRGKNQDDLMPCTEAVINYFNSNSAVQPIQQLELRLLEDQKVFYTTQMHIIDSLMTNPSQVNTHLYLNQNGSMELLSDASYLLELKEEYIQRIADIELDIYHKASNITVLSYGVVREL